MKITVRRDFEIHGKRVEKAATFETKDDPLPELLEKELIKVAAALFRSLDREEAEQAR